MEKTIHFDGLKYPLAIENTGKCPTCKYTKAVKIYAGGGSFAAWCPCGTIWTEKKVLQEPENLPNPNWWENPRKEE